MKCIKILDIKHSIPQISWASDTEFSRGVKIGFMQILLT